VKAKTPDLWVEFKRAHPKIIAMLFYADWYAREQFGHEILLTDVDRTQEGYDQTYAKDVAGGFCPTFKDRDGKLHYGGFRPHLYDPINGVRSHAGDVGVVHGTLNQVERLTDKEARQLAAHINEFWPRSDGKPSALYHDTGSGMHLHLQCVV